MSEKMVDCIVIGAGLAGISAALTLHANGNTFRLLADGGVSDKVGKAEDIRNYPGYVGDGKGFSALLAEQLVGAGIEIEPFRVSKIYPMGEKFLVVSQEGATVEGRTVVLAMGVQSVKSVEGEEDYLGRGVSYCATCDGFLYKDKTIAVLCADKKYEDEVAHLASFAKKVYLFPLYKGCGVSQENVEIFYNMPTRVFGEKRVEKLTLKRPLSSGENTLLIDGFFVLKDGVSPTVLLDGLEMKEGSIVVDNNTATSVQGVFAAGDCTGRPYQYAKAAGEGNVAAFAVKEFCKG